MTTNDNIWVAAGDGNVERVKELVASGVDVNIKDEFGYTPMHAAVSYNHVPIVEFLLENNADINIEDQDKDTPLYVAETPEMARYLVEHGADALHKNVEGITPTRTAFQEGWQETAAYLSSITNEVLEEEDFSQDSASTENNLSQRIQQIIQQMPDVDTSNDEQLREIVTKMVLEEIQRQSQ